MADTNINTGGTTVGTTGGPTVGTTVGTIDNHLPIYLIYSRWSLQQIENFLTQYGPVGYLRIILDKAGVETDRTIAIISSDTFELLKKNGYDEHQYGKDFMITPFVLRKLASEAKHSLFVPVPKEIASFDSNVIDEINGRMVHFSEWGIITSDAWQVTAPLLSRETGGIRNGCFITFKKTLPLETVSLIRLLLTDTYWRFTPQGSDPIRFNCYWTRTGPPPTKGRIPSNPKFTKKDPTIQPHKSPKILQQPSNNPKGSPSGGPQQKPSKGPQQKQSKGPQQKPSKGPQQKPSKEPRQKIVKPQGVPTEEPKNPSVETPLVEVPPKNLQWKHL